MEKKIAYLTHWMPRDEKKEYPHGWGFDAPVVFFASEKDPVEVRDWCRDNLSNDEFKCIYAIPTTIVLPETEENKKDLLKAMSAFIRCGYMHAVSELQEWALGFQDEGVIPMLNMKLLEMDDIENKKQINFKLLQNSFDIGETKNKEDNG